MSDAAARILRDPQPELPTDPDESGMRHIGPPPSASDLPVWHLYGVPARTRPLTARERFEADYGLLPVTRTLIASIAALTIEEAATLLGGRAVLPGIHAYRGVHPHLALFGTRSLSAGFIPGNGFAHDTALHTYYIGTRRSDD